MNTKLLIATSIIALIITTCKNPAEPEPEPGRRDYVWTIDTITVYGGSNHGIYAADTNDIWVAFAGSESQKLLHYNGKEWQKKYIKAQYQPGNITGNKFNDIWIVPEFGDIQHYNGNYWDNFGTVKNTKFKLVIFYQIAFGENGQIFLVGTGTDREIANPVGIIVKFQDGKCELVELPEIKGQFVNITYDRTTKNFYILKWSEGDYEEIYSFDGNEIKFFMKGLGIGNREIGKKTYFNKNGYVYTISNNRLKKVWNEQIDKDNYFSMYGISEKDFFLFTRNAIKHCNGLDIKTLQEIPGDQFIGPYASIGKNVAAFVTINKFNSQYYIYIGKLRQHS